MERKTISLRMDNAIYKQIKKLADKDQRTVNNYIEVVLAKHITAQKSEK